MAQIRSVSWRRNISSGFELMSLQELRQKKKSLNHCLTETQRLDFHLLLLFENGTGSHMVDFKMYDCRRGTLIHVSPNQVHAFGQMDSNQGTVLIFRPELLPTDFFGPDSRSYPPEYIWPPATTLKGDSLEYAEVAFKFLKRLQTSQGVWDQLDAARHVAIGLASLAYRMAATSDALYQSQPQPLFFAFLAELEKYHHRRRDAKWYAGKLDCSYRNLCRICKLASGQTPKTIIDRRVTTEARRLLAFTADSAREIGESLGFSEPTNFVKFFQRITGETPDSFRSHWQR